MSTKYVSDSEGAPCVLPLSLSLSLSLSPSPKSTTAVAGAGRRRKPTCLPPSLPLSLSPSLPRESVRMRRSKRQSPIERTVPFLPLSLLFLRDPPQGDPAGFHPEKQHPPHSNQPHFQCCLRKGSILFGHPVRVGGESRAPAVFCPPGGAYQFPYGLRHRFFDPGGPPPLSAAGRMTQGGPRDTDRKSASSPFP